jgi:hypothetical protein
MEKYPLASINVVGGAETYPWGRARQFTDASRRFSIRHAKNAENECPSGNIRWAGIEPRSQAAIGGRGLHDLPKLFGQCEEGVHGHIRKNF